jgi:glycine betaine/proline transport system ATP-binding protein
MVGVQDALLTVGWRAIFYIMRLAGAGKSTLIGTTEEIMTSPADGYVAEFVTGLFKLDLVTAVRIMQPLAAYVQTRGPQGTFGWPVGRPKDKLNELVDLAGGTDQPILIMAEASPVGVVRKRALLRGI